ncbi:phage terminase large subunit [Robertmurraya andreesenii]|uniref:Phage terminase large subunit-like protein n=1 Tax=Anoxybacillus andreesenii TaxID=1325932 RepID=A0ABT9V1V5_9BACL|nr:phage terminase large subunit [Robertmurraya andreesenii]MDQ0154924.1 putative phage terminase large subunit-like protein [Robertmurraya andreesenii]
MAYINGEWLDRDQRAQRIDLLTERLRKLVMLVKSGKATEYHVEMLRHDKTELAKLKRVHRAEVDIAYFTYTYLSDGGNPGNDDNVIRHSDDGTAHDPIELIAPIHREFFDLCDHVNEAERNARLAIAAARGHSKSGVFSNAFPLHQVAFRKRRYILLISETDSLSKKLIGWINKQLKFNALFREDFGMLLHERNQMNEKDNEEAFITTSNTLVEASSSGKQLRGKRHGAVRPDLVIIDDPSSMNNEGTKEAREKLVHWFNSVVVPIGSASTAIVLVGTMVSATGLLNHVLKRKDFKSSFHGAVISEPSNPKLWEQYCEVYARADSMEEVDEFYNANKDELEEGVELAWPWRWSYRALMHEKVNMGTRAYNSEYRNLAFSEDEQFFFPDNYAKYHYVYENGRTFISYEDKRIPMEDLYVVGAWDIAMGKNKRSDYNSIIIVGKHSPTGLIFVLDEHASKEPAHTYIDVAIAKIKQFNVRIFNVETINAYHEFYRQLQEKARVMGVYKCRINDIKNQKSSKEQRIESLEPILHNKTLVLNDRHTLLLDQMAQYPFGDHDDSIDALQMAVDNIFKPKARIAVKPSYL